MKNFFSSKLVLIEFFVILSPVFSYYIIGAQNKKLYAEFFINSEFIALLVLLFIFRNSSIRHLYFAFVLLILAAFANGFGFDNFVYISSSLALSLLILGIINMLLFTKEDK